MGTAEAQHHPGVVVLQPAQREQHLLLVPNPADVVLQAGVLSDVVEAGRHRHVNHRTSLAGMVQKGREQIIYKTDVLLSWLPNLCCWRCPLPLIALQSLCQGEALGKPCLETGMALSQLLYKSCVISGPGICLFLQHEAAPILFLILLMVLVLQNQKNEK